MRLKKLANLGIAAALATTGMAAALPAAYAQNAEVEGPKVKWLLSMWGNRRGFSEGVEGLAAYVSEKTGGNFEISIEYGEVLSPSKENLDGLYIGKRFPQFNQVFFLVHQD